MRRNKMDIDYLKKHIVDVDTIIKHEGSLRGFNDSKYKSVKAYRNARERDEWRDFNHIINKIMES